MTVLRGKFSVELDGNRHEAQYEVRGLDRDYYELTVWYRGNALTERVQPIALDVHEDATWHAPDLLKRLIRSEGA